MAKSWHYPRWRRVALQVVMGVVLAASLGVAAYVQRQRRPQPVALGQATVRGELIYAMPNGWKVPRGAEADPADFAVEEPQRPTRTVRVTQFRLDKAMDGNALLERLLGLPLTPEDVEPIEFLGEQGASVAIKEGLFAAVVRPGHPSGKYGLGVIVTVRGPGAYGPSSRRLLREVVGSMRVAPATEEVVDTTADVVDAAVEVVDATVR